MNRKFIASLLASALVWASAAPAAHALASKHMAPEVLRPPTLPPSVLPLLGLPGGIAAGAAQDALRGNAPKAPSSRAMALGAALPAPAGAASAALPGATSPISPSPAAIPLPQGWARATMASLARAIAAKLPWARVFDNKGSAASPAPVGLAGLRPLPKPVLPQGTDLNLSDAPATPAPKTVGGVSIAAFALPQARGLSGGIFDAGPRLLDADPRSEADMERALRALVDADAATYGVTSADLSKVHIVHREGQGDQADTVYAYFQQQRTVTNKDQTVERVVIHGSALSFVVKVIKGRPQLLAAQASLYPNISVNTNATLDDEEAKALALKKLGTLAESMGIGLAFSGRKILFHDNAWKAVALYDIEGLPQALGKAAGIKIAVDIATQEVFAWDARLGSQARAENSGDLPAEAAAKVTVTARAEADDHRQDGKPVLVSLALPSLYLSVSGKSGVTGTDGAWTTTVAGGAELKAKLEGKWAKVNDQNRKPVVISATINPGDNIVVANPTASDLKTIDQVNMYIWITRIHDWWSTRLGADKRIDKQLPVNVNIDDECNAYYTPGHPSLNFFQESRNCSDSGRPGVGAHEYGHFVDDMIGGIVNGGLSEGWGDIGSMFLLGTPIIGEGFLKRQNPSWIRHGDNNYQYRDSDEVHDQGQAWMGFAWKLRKRLIAKYGEAAGIARTEALIIPTLFAKASDIPGQMAQVLLNAMDKNGNVRDEAEIRASAKDHGIDLPKNPKIIETLWNGLASLWRGVSVVAGPVFSTSPWVKSLGFVEDKTPAATTVLTLNAGFGQRDELLRKIKAALKYRSGEHAGISMFSIESRGILGSTIELRLSGPQKSVDYMAEQIKRLAKQD